MILLVDKLDKSKVRAHGILLDNELKSELDVGEFTLWLHSPESWSQVRCRVQTIESIGSGRNQEGRHVTFLNDEVPHKDTNMAAVHSGFNFYLDEAVADRRPPFFLLTDKNSAPAVCKARVQLHFSRLSELPDVQGGALLLREFMRELDRNWKVAAPEFASATSSEPRSEAYLTETDVHARETSPHEGLWLPFEIGQIHGAMQLGEDRGGEVFDAMLYVDRGAETIRPGSLLRRSVTWTAHDGESGSAEADIASIVELLPAKPL